MLGALNYESAQGALPRSGLVDQTFLTYQKQQYEVYDQHSGRMLSWIVQLLPQIEQQSLYDQFDMDRNVTDQPNNPQATFLPSLACPSDSSQARYYSDATNAANRSFAKGNYAAYCSPMHSDLQLLYPGAFIATGLTLRRIEDGLGHTIGMSEVRTADDPLDERGAWALPWNAASLLALDMHLYQMNASKSNQTLSGYDFLRFAAYQAQVPNSHNGYGDILVNCSQDSYLNEGKVLNNQLEGLPCSKQKWPLGLTGYTSSAPRSQHIGGVNASYLDGRVEFISDDINAVLYSYHIGIRDGEIPSEIEVSAYK
jgi:prepilin-type processing-associated H-X9-DG protein